MTWTSYIFDISTLYEMYRSTVYDYRNEHPFFSLSDVEVVFDNLIQIALERVLEKKQPKLKRHFIPLTRTHKDLVCVYYDLIGFAIESRMEQILSSKEIHHSPEELVKVLVLDTSLFVNIKHFHP